MAVRPPVRSIARAPQDAAYGRTLPTTRRTEGRGVDSQGPRESVPDQIGSRFVDPWKAR